MRQSNLQCFNSGHELGTTDDLSTGLHQHAVANPAMRREPELAARLRRDAPSACGRQSIERLQDEERSIDGSAGGCQDGAGDLDEGSRPRNDHPDIEMPTAADGDCRRAVGAAREGRDNGMGLGGKGHADAADIAAGRDAVDGGPAVGVGSRLPAPMPPAHWSVRCRENLDAHTGNWRARYRRERYQRRAPPRARPYRRLTQVESR